MEDNNNISILQSNVLKVEKNVIEMDDSIIQLSNIASVSLRYPPKFSYNNTAIAGFLFGLCLLFMGNSLTVAGLFLMMIFGYLLYRTWDKNTNLGKNIIISTGSGGYFWINSKDDKFSLQVISVIKNLMNDPGRNSNVVINLDKMNIINKGNIVQGDVIDSTINKDSTTYSNIDHSIIGDDNEIKAESVNDIPELRI